MHDLITSYLKEKERVVSVSQEFSSFQKSHFSGFFGCFISHIFFLLLIFEFITVLQLGGSEKRSLDTPKSLSETTKKGSIDIDIFAKDWRNFNCKSWHLEPTVRLMSVAGKYIEPYGVDYILQKLGFSHARVTIPKWLQRGFMDPLDAILAVLAFNMVLVIKGEGNKDKEKTAENKN